MKMKETSTIYNFLAKIAVLFVCLVPTTTHAQSVLSEGRWHKIGVVERGIYQLDKAFLESQLGLDVNNLDPNTIRIFSDGNGGMLPQANGDFRRPLTENAIMVTGAADGSFDDNDLIIFYGNGPHLHELDADGTLTYEKNIYSDTSFYFINVGTAAGLRIAGEAQLDPQGAAVYDYYDDYISYEQDVLSVRSEGRQWHDIQLFRNASLTYDIPLDIAGINDEKDLTMEAEVLSVSDAASTFEFSVNGQLLGEIGIAARPNGQYVSVGFERNDLFTVSPGSIPNIGSNLDINLNYVPQSGFANGYLDYLLLQFSRDLSLYNSVTFFRSLESTANEKSTFLVGDVSNDALLWDVTDPVAPVGLDYSIASEVLQFTTATATLREFVVFKAGELMTPVSAVPVSNQNILGDLNTDGLIVTYPAFLSQANRLAAFHEAQDGLSVTVVTTDQIYNQFSSGRQDLTAIRDYVKYLYDNGGQRLKYLLLFGDCSFDYKKRFPIDHNFVPVYQARESLHPIYSYSSDDFFGFMEDDEGEWIESERGDHTLEIGVGRLPAKTLEEADVFIDKIIRYTADSKSLGSWRNNIFFIADDGDNNIHQGDAEKLATQIERLQEQFNAEKIYLDAFQQVSSPNGERSPVTSDRIIDMIENGALIVNFTGHGNTGVWTDERVINKEDIQNLSNRNKLALFVTATCQFGQYDNPLESSGGEELLLNPNGGAIALVTTTRPVFSNTNFVLNRAFYDAAFEGGLAGKRLGDILRVTKNTSLRGRVNRNFALLGDPMMQLNVPEYSIELNEVQNITNDTDTISALSLIRLSGNILNGAGQQASDFAGELTVTIFDKASTLRPLGNQNSPFEYSVRNTLLFKGNASVVAGDFTMEFVAPKNIAYNFDSGKIGLYAVKADESADAAGADTEVIVGGSASSVASDNTPPVIELFINDETFQSGDRVGANPLLLARLSDDSGINISNRGFGQSLVGILNDTTEIVLNDYYTASANTYQEGWVSFPFRDLAAGKYQLKIKVWDVHNNLSESSVDFVVSNDVELALRSVYNYPNPITSETTFLIDHDREGEELLISLDIYSLKGEIVHQQAYRFDNPDSVIEEIQWDGRNASGAPVNNGVYIYKIKVTSTLDGASNEIFRRLVISK